MIFQMSTNEEWDFLFQDCVDYNNDVGEIGDERDVRNGSSRLVLKLERLPVGVSTRAL